MVPAVLLLPPGLTKSGGRGPSSLSFRSWRKRPERPLSKLHGEGAWQPVAGEVSRMLHLTRGQYTNKKGTVRGRAMPERRLQGTPHVSPDAAGDLVAISAG